MTGAATQTGRAFVFDDNISTDVLAPGPLMKLPPAELAAHCLESIDPDFAKSVREGDVIAAGHNFGLGSSREQAAVSLKLLGVKAIVAKSFARIFYRNAINVGLMAFSLPQADEIKPMDRVHIDAEAGRVENLTSGKSYEVAPLPPHLMAMIRDGGLLPHLKQRLAQRSVSGSSA